MSEFRVGEIAVFHKAILNKNKKYEGSDIHIIGGPKLIKVLSTGDVFTGYIGLMAGKRKPFRIWQLRKKKPPLGRWKDIEAETNWNSVKETTFINE